MIIYNNNNNSKENMSKIYNLVHRKSLLHKIINKINYYINNCHKVKFNNFKNNNKRTNTLLSIILLKKAFMKKVKAQTDNILLFLHLRQK